MAFQSPSLRGSGRFEHSSLQVGTVIDGFNPLHCGAVVASAARRGAARRKKRCFNPLHCGAVVASYVVVLSAVR